MAIKMFAAIDVGSFELEMGIYEISQSFGISRPTTSATFLPLEGRPTMTEKSATGW